MRLICVFCCKFVKRKIGLFESYDNTGEKIHSVFFSHSFPPDMTSFLRSFCEELICKRFLFSNRENLKIWTKNPPNYKGIKLERNPFLSFRNFFIPFNVHFQKSFFFPRICLLKVRKIVVYCNKCR
jgi:hypothetical protein